MFVTIRSSKPIGAWNAGIVDYLSLGGVVNLDGLVNDDAVPYVLSNSLKKFWLRGASIVWSMTPSCGNHG
jgi:hypothetical protein